MVWVGRDLIDQLVPTPLAMGKGPCPLDQLAQSPIQPGCKRGSKSSRITCNI